MSRTFPPRTVAVSARKARRSAALLLLVGLALAGCRGPRVLSGEAISPGPAQRESSPAEQLRTANATPRAVASFSAACRLSLVTPDGDTVNLDGVIIAAEPGSLRLQAWKFDRPALDLTVTPAGRFLFVRGEDGVPEGFAGIPEGGLPTLAPLLTELPESGFQVDPLDAAVVRWPSSAFGIDATATIAATLDGGCVERLVVRSAAGEELQSVAFSNFRALDGVAWPMDWTLTGELAGTILLEDVELNPDLPPGAFDPPSRAKPF